MGFVRSETERSLFHAMADLMLPLRLSFADVRSMLEVVLQNLGRERRAHFRSLRAHGAHDLSATDHLGGCQSGNFGGQHQADLQLRIRLQQFLRAKQQPRTTDVLGCARAPAFLSQRTIAQRQVEVEAASPEG